MESPGVPDAERLVCEHLGWVRGWLGAHLHGRERQEIDDLCQEAFLRGVHRLRRPEAAPAWIFRVARNVLADHLLSTRWRGTETPGAPDAAASVGDGRSPLASAERGARAGRRDVLRDPDPPHPRGRGGRPAAGARRNPSPPERGRGDAMDLRRARRPGIAARAGGVGRTRGALPAARQRGWRRGRRGPPQRRGGRRGRRALRRDRGGGRLGRTRYGPGSATHDVVLRIADHEVVRASELPPFVASLGGAPRSTSSSRRRSASASSG